MTCAASPRGISPPTAAPRWSCSPRKMQTRTTRRRWPMPHSPVVAVLPPPVPGAPPRPRTPRPERWTMENGLRVVALRKHTIPQVVIRLVIPAGAAGDPREYPGTASLVAHLLTEGTQSMSADELNARLDLLGAAVHANVSHD